MSGEVAGRLAEILKAQQSPAFPAHTVRRPAGYVQGASPEAPLIERDTLQCRHCGAHWVHEPGSGRERGWCGRCAGPICGQAICMIACVPHEQMIEEIERRGQLDAAIARARGL